MFKQEQKLHFWFSLAKELDSIAFSLTRPQWTPMLYNYVSLPKHGQKLGFLASIAWVQNPSVD